MGKISVATIDTPEFINITSINPLISECEIKVLYIGANRNKSFIDKNTATAIGRTLPGSPIVGYYKSSKQDFTDHGEQIIFDDEGMKINDLTRPYGFVPTDAKVWFQKFIDTDEFGNETEREYLMTTGYLWTGQYEEAQKIYDSQDGNPQSMKLDDKTLKGYWSENIKTGVDFFIINDAIIQNLCILGEDVEPCFEGANITAPQLSVHFSKDNHFVTTLFTMMKELNEVLKNKEGGYSMKIPNTNIEDIQVTTEETSQVEDLEVQVEEQNSLIENETEEEKNVTEQDKVDENVVDENQNITEEFAKTSDDEEDKKDEADNSDEAKDSKKNEDDEEDAKKKYELLSQEYEELKNNYTQLETSYQELVDFKNTIDNEKKDALIQEFYMLSDEDKKEVIENKTNYSLDEIEAKLSIICVRKKVSFDLGSNTTAANDTAPMTYNLNSVEDNLPAWLKAVEATKNRNQ